MIQCRTGTPKLLLLLSNVLIDWKNVFKESNDVLIGSTNSQEEIPFTVIV